MNVIILSMIFGFVAPQFDAQTLDGRSLSGVPVELTAESLVLDTADGRVSLPTEDILMLAAKNAHRLGLAQGVVVELVDGSKIIARSYTVQDGRAQITIEGGQTVEAPISAVQSVRLRQSAALDAEWAKLTAAESDSDLLVIVVNETLDSHKGVIQNVTDDAVEFNLDGELLPVKRSKVYGFVYRHSLGDAPTAAACLITDVSGSRWSARSAALEGDNLQWITSSGLNVSQPLENVVRLDYSIGKLLYLSDLTPESTTWTPYFGGRQPLPAMRLFYAPRFNRGFDSDTLKLGDVEYVKGVALFARTELVYRLPQGFQRFRAVAGIDGDASGKVRLIVRGDDRVLLETDIADKSKPLDIELDVTGCRRLTIVVDFGDDPGAGDRLLLCNARIVK